VTSAGHGVTELEAGGAHRPRRGHGGACRGGRPGRRSRISRGRPRPSAAAWPVRPCAGEPARRQRPRASAERPSEATRPSAQPAPARQQRRRAEQHVRMRDRVGRSPAAAREQARRRPVAAAGETV